MTRVGTESLALPLLAGATVLFLGSSAAGAIYLHEQNNLWRSQAAELENNPAVFAITRPEQRPHGRVVTSWERGGYDGTHQFALSIGANGASLSDPYQPTAVKGRLSGPIVSCSSLNLDVYSTQHFKLDGKPHQVLLTKLGNAAVCVEGQ